MPTAVSTSRRSTATRRKWNGREARRLMTRRMPPRAASVPVKELPESLSGNQSRRSIAHDSSPRYPRSTTSVSALRLPPFGNRYRRVAARAVIDREACACHFFRAGVRTHNADSTFPWLIEMLGFFRRYAWGRHRFRWSPAGVRKWWRGSFSVFMRWAESLQIAAQAN